MLAIAYGTRPERLKLLSLFAELRRQDIPFVSIFSGQHEATRDYGDFDVDFILETEEDRLNGILSSYSRQLSKFLQSVPAITTVLVQGDTATTFVSALVSFNRGLKVIYLESGLRSFDKFAPFPEETNRCLVSQLADIHLCATEQNKTNLEKEGVIGEKWVIGQSGLDILPREPVTYEKIILITFHRTENITKTEEFFQNFNDLALAYPDYRFVFPLHWNPLLRKFSHLLKNIEVSEPLSQPDLLALVRKCSMILSDSGGICEEAAFYKKKILILRGKTERSECLGLNGYLCPKPENLRDLFEEHIDNPIPEDYICPFGDGMTAQRVVKILKEIL